VFKKMPKRFSTYSTNRSLMIQKDLSVRGRANSKEILAAR
jgi:hypothetical protein